MAEKELLLNEKLEHTGIFDFQGLYSYAHSWFKDESYNVQEEKYVEKVSGNGRDISFEWKTTKKLSDYFGVEHKIKVSAEKITDVEVEIDGDKKHMNKGKIVIEIKSTIVMDPEGKWEATPYYRFMRDVYNKYIVPGRVDSMKSKVTSDGRKFKEDMKSYLELVGRM